jgi:hypothetical protein
MDYTATYLFPPQSRARLCRHLLLRKICRQLPLWTVLAAMTAWLSEKYLDEDQQSAVLGFTAGIAFVILRAWVTLYRHQIRYLNSPEGQSPVQSITLTLSDLNLQVVTPTHNRMVNWTHINRLRRTSQLVHLSHGRLLLFQLPREQLSPEVLDFIRRKISTSRQSAR